MLVQTHIFLRLRNGAVDVADGEGTHNALRINVLVHILLNLGAKSFSHSFAAIAKFHSTFKALAEAEDGGCHVWMGGEGMDKSLLPQS